MFLSIYYWGELWYATMFTIHISDVKATLWIFDRLLVLYLNCKSVMNFVPINFYFVFFTSPDKQKFKENLFSYTLYYIYWNKAVEDLHAEWVCISDDGFLEVLYKLEIFITYLVHLVVFCHFYMFVLNKLFYSECIRWRQCVLIDYMCSPSTLNTSWPHTFFSCPYTQMF